jgi:hypothetical protein
MSGTQGARFKVVYLLAVTFAAFAVPAIDVSRSLQWIVVPALALLQILLLLRARVPFAEVLRTSTRLRWLFVFLLLMYAFLPAEPGARLLLWRPFGALTLTFNLSGVAMAGMMILQIVTVLLVSAWVRLSGDGADLVRGLRAFGLPKLLVLSLDFTLALMGGARPRGGGGGGGRGMGGGRGGGGGGGGGRGMGGGRGGGGGRGDGSGGGRGGGRGRNEDNAVASAAVGGSTAETVSAAAAGSTAEAVSAAAAGSTAEMASAAAAGSTAEAASAAAAGSPLTGDDGGGVRTFLRAVTRGDMGVFTRSIQQSMEQAREHVAAAEQAGEPLDDHLSHDVAVITGISLMMMSLKILKILPGIPFFSGYKTILLYPLYILAADRTRSRWGATVCGTIMGVIGFLQGDGRYGAMEILKHVAPGFTVDLLWPLMRALPPSAVVYCLLGLVLALARTSTEFATVLLLRPRDEILLFPLAKLLPNVTAGVLSGFVTRAVVPAVRSIETAPPRE